MMPKQPMSGKPKPTQPGFDDPYYEPITSNPISKQELDALKEKYTQHDVTEDQRARMEAVRAHSLEHAQFLMHFAPKSRELSLALTNLEQATMWANAAIAREKMSEG
jgi:hypothetical protein